MSGLKKLWQKLLNIAGIESSKDTEKLDSIEEILSTTEALVAQNWLAENLHRDLNPREIPHFLKTLPDVESPLFDPAARLAPSADSLPESLPLSHALGKLSAGQRSSTFTSLPALSRELSALREALARRLPLPVTAIADAASDDSGATPPPPPFQFSAYFPLQWWASSPQEAVDLSLILRKLSELFLLPSLLLLRRTEQAQLIQPLNLFTLQSLRSYLGKPDDFIETPTPEQSAIFGEKRLRIPPIVSPQNPVLSGVSIPSEARAKAQLARSALQPEQIAQYLRAELEEFHRLTGRKYQFLTQTGEGNKLLLIAPATLREPVFSAAEKVRGAKAAAVHLLNPFPRRELAEAARCVREIWVVDDNIGEFGAFEEKVRGVLHQLTGERAKINTVYFGFPGTKASTADLLKLLNSPPPIGEGPYFLGIEAFPKTEYPQRIAIADRLKEKFPQFQKRAIPPAEKAGPSEDFRLLELWNAPGTARQKSAARILSALLRETEGAEVIAQIDSSTPNSARPASEKLAFTFKDKEKLSLDSLPSLLLIRQPFTPSLGRTLRKILPNLKVILLETSETIGEIWTSLPQDVRELLYGNRLKLYAVRPYHQKHLYPVYLAGAVISALEKEKWIEGKKSLQLNTLSELYPKNAEKNVHSAFKAAFLKIKALDPSQLSEELEPDKTPSPSTHLSKLFFPVEREPQLPEFIKEITARSARESAPEPGSTPPAYADLTEFWHRTALLYREGREDELLADPALNADALPAASAALGSWAHRRNQWPKFDPQLCTGCGICWTSCPDGAIGATALTLKELLKSTIELSEKLGKSAQSIQMLSNQLVSSAAKLLKKGEANYSDAAELFRASFDSIKDKLPFDDKKKSELSEGIDALTQAAKNIPISITEPLYRNLESRERGTGTVLTIAVDPHFCKGCGICASVCPEGAFQMEDSPEPTDELLETRKKWELLDDTSAKTVSLLKDQIGQLPALLLTRAVQQSFIPGATPLAGSGTKLALRHVSALAEYYRQSVLSKYIRELEILRDKLREKLKSQFISHFPAEQNPQLLRELLTQLHSETVQPSQLLAQLESHTQLTALDTQQLELFAETIEKIEAIIDSIAGKNPRSRFYAVLSPSTPLQHLTSFPYNPFAVPTINARSADVPSLVMGLIEGLKEKFLREVGFVRFAYNLLENPATAPQRRAELQKLTWEQLSPDEQHLFPPVLVLSPPGQLNTPSLANLLAQPYPIKILLLSDGIELTENIDGPSFTGAELPLWSLRFRDNFILQTAPSSPEHLAEGVLQGLKFPGPAIFHLYAAEPELNGFSPRELLKNTEEAVASRIFPLFSYSPLSENSFSLRLNLDGNPDISELWGTIEGKPTPPVQWLFRQERFREYLREDDGQLPAVALESYLQLSPLERRTKYPSAVDPHSKKNFVLLSPLRELIAETAERWKTLLELTGRQNPFAQQLREELAAEINRQKEAEIEELRRQHQKELSEIREKLTAELLGKFQQGLLKLAGYQTDNRSN